MELLVVGLRWSPPRKACVCENSRTPREMLLRLSSRQLLLLFARLSILCFLFRFLAFFAAKMRGCLCLAGCILLFTCCLKSAPAHPLTKTDGCAPPLSADSVNYARNVVFLRPGEYLWLRVAVSQRVFRCLFLSCLPED